MGVTVKLRDGDVFSIPLGDGRAGLGQIVGHYGESAYFFAIFDSVVPEQEIPIKFQDLLAGPVKFLALSMDAKLHVGDWRVVAQAPIRADIPLPAYKEAVTTHDHIDVVDHSGTRRRRATKAEATSLPNRSIVAPVRLERALKASLGLEQWLEAYEELRPHGITSREAFPELSAGTRSAKSPE